MKISRFDLARISASLIGVLDMEGIDLDYVIDNQDRLFDLPGFPNMHIDLNSARSNFGTRAYKISCVHQQTRDLPLEVVINPQLDYSQIVTKSGEEIEGYLPFPIDRYDEAGNIRQYKKIFPADFSKVRAELESLAKTQ